MRNAALDTLRDRVTGAIERGEAEAITEVAAAGTVLGIVEAGETLAGWEIVATGDGGAITMKSGNCWGAYPEGAKVAADAGWDAVTARLWGRLTDEEVLAKLREAATKAEQTREGTMAKVAAQAAFEATFTEAEKRRLV